MSTRWEKIGPVRSGKDSAYVGWSRRHPKIHMLKGEPAGKSSLVQVNQSGDIFTILAQTTAHGVFTQPPGTKGTTLFKKVTVRRTKSDAMAEVRRLKKILANRYDRVTNIQEKTHRKKGGR